MSETKATRDHSFPQDEWITYVDERTYEYAQYTDGAIERTNSFIMYMLHWCDEFEPEPFFTNSTRFYQLNGYAPADSEIVCMFVLWDMKNNTVKTQVVRNGEGDA